MIRARETHFSLDTISSHHLWCVWCFSYHSQNIMHIYAYTHAYTLSCTYICTHVCILCICITSDSVMVNTQRSLGEQILYNRKQAIEHFKGHLTEQLTNVAVITPFQKSSPQLSPHLPPHSLPPIHLARFLRSGLLRAALLNCPLRCTIWYSSG